MMSAEKKIYFISDLHLGVPTLEDSHERELKLICFLDSIKDETETLFLMGDLFDFWFEYKTVVPRGYVRLLGKLAQFVDEGIPVHLFAGNHDLWTFGYLEKEIGLKVHRKPTIFDIKGKQFFLAPGDGLNDKSKGFAFIRKIFHSKTCQWLFRTLIPPSIGLNSGYKWSESNRKKHLKNGECKYKGENNEPLVCFAKQHNQKSPDINYYVFGHRHILLHLMLNAKTQMAILGDFMQQFTYVTFDGKNFEIHYFENE